MASRASRRKANKPGDKSDAPTPPRPTPGIPKARAQRPIEPMLVRRGRIEVALGVVCVIGGIALAIGADDGTLTVVRFLSVYVLGMFGALSIAMGGSRLDRRPGGPATADKRRWIYGGLAAGFAVIYAFCMWKVIPNRLPSAMLHLATVPAFTLLMATGTLMGGRLGWWLAVVSGSIVLLSTIILIARILASAAFLAGVYGAFGKAASTFALVSVALLVEIVGLLPICQVKFLMSRPGRRTYGI